MIKVTLNDKIINLNVVALENIYPYENNVKIHPVRQLEGVAQSIDQFGFKQPIVIDKNNVIVAGHARYEAAAALGMKELLCVMADDLNEEQIKAYRILDNEIAKQGSTDLVALKSELSLLPGFDFKPYNVEFAKIDLPEMKVPEEEKEDNEKLITCPSCEH